MKTKTSNHLSKLLLTATCAAACLLLVSPVHAQTTWDGGGGADTNINTAANWNNDIVADLSGTAALTFAASGTATINTASNLGKATFTTPFTIASGTGSFAIRGSNSGTTVTLQTNSGATTVNINQPLLVTTVPTAAPYGNLLVINVNQATVGATALFINNGISRDPASTGASTYDIRYANGGGGFSNTRIAGTISGLGTLANANSAWAGDLIIAGTQSSTGSSNITISSGSGFTNPTAAARVVLGETAADTQSWGAITLNNTMTVAVGGNVTATSLSGTGNSKVVGYTGTNGTLTLGSGTVNPNMVIGGTGAFQNNITLVKSGAGTLTLNGTNTYTGGTQITGGVLSISSTAAMPGLLLSGSYSVGSGAFLAVGNSVSDSDVTTMLGTGNFLAGSGIRYDTSAGNRTLGSPLSTSIGLAKSGTNTLTLTGVNTTGAVTVVSGTLAGSGSLTGSSYDVQVGSVSISLGGASAALTKTTSGTVVNLTGSNSYGGLTTVSAGILSVQAAGALGTSGSAVSVASGGTLEVANGLTISRDISIAGAGSGGSGGALRAGTGGGTWAGQVTIADGSARIGATAGNTLTITGSIVGSGTNQSITIDTGSATGIVLLNPSGTNGYTGTTNITRGILKLGKNDALPTTTVLDGKNVSTGNTTQFDLGGFNQTVAGLKTSGTDAPTLATLTNSGSNTTSTLTVNNTTSHTFGGAIVNGAGGTGVVSLVKTGSGTLTFTNTNTYSGGTTISTGVLAISNIPALPGALVSGSYSVANGATLAVTNAVAEGDVGTMLGTTNFAAGAAIGFDNSSGNRTLTSAIGNTGQGALGLYKSGTGTLLLSVANTYSGGTTITSGTLQLGNGSALGSSGGALAVKGGTLDLNGNSITVGALSGNSAGLISSSVAGSVVLTSSSATSGTYAGVIANGSGTVGLTKSGNGTLTLSGASNTFGGSLTVNGGTLALAAPGSIGTSSTAAPIIMNSGTLSYTSASNLVSDNIAVTVGGGDATIAVTAGSSTTFRAGGPLTGSGNLNIVGPGVVAFGQNIATTLGSTYSGTLTVKNGGQLDIRNPDSMGTTGTSARTIVESGGTLMINPFGQPLGVTFDAETLEFQGASSLVNRNQLTGTSSAAVTNTLTGPISTSGTLTISSTVSSGSSAAILAINAAISGTGALTFGGVNQPGTYELNGTNSYSGKTTVNTGTVKFGVSETLTGGLEIATSGTAVLTAHSGGAANVKVLDITGLTISGTTAFAGGGGKATDIAGYGSELASPAPVPEPGTIGMLALGAIGGLLLRRRNRRGGNR